MGLAEPIWRHIRVIRHGKSADGGPGMADHDRPLNSRGESDGLRMQAWLERQPHPAAWVWSSTAVRARSTAAFVAHAFNAPLIEEPVLYLASAEQILATLQTTPGDVTSVAVVAHNPGLTYLVNLLADEPVIDNLVTFGCALFRTQLNWPDLHRGGAELISLATPKMI